MSRKGGNPAGASQSEILRRREIVADYMLRGKDSNTLISEALIAADLFNPDTNLPYTEPTISTDKKWVREQWAQECVMKYDHLVGDVVKRQRLVFQLAIDAGDYASALNALKGIREVLDIDKPRGSRAVKRAADERAKNGGEGMTEAEAGQKALQLDNTPAVFGEMLQIMRDVGALDAALIRETEGQKEAKEMHESALHDELSPASNGNGNGRMMKR